MSIKEQLTSKINEIVEKIKSNPSIAANFQSNPIGTVESLLGIDLPDDQLKGVVDAVKTKINLDKAGDALSGLKGLFGK